MSRPSSTVAGRLKQTRNLLASEGVSGIMDRVRSRAAKRIEPPGANKLPVSRADLLRAAEVAENGWVLPDPMPWRPGEPLTVAWVDVPPSRGSGGQTTIFRIMAELERAGHTCVLYLLDQHGWSIDEHRRTIARWWPWLNAEVRELAAGIDDAHAIFATCWESAYPVLASPARGARCYFVQDFEPLFSPAGSEYLLAEATYRFGFQGITAGQWLAQLLQKDYGMEAEHFDFGCDLETYRLDAERVDTPERTGIAYYCRPSTPRRAHELAVIALDLFASRHPEVDIHFFGEPAGKLSFRATHHGLLSPDELGALYRRCIAGLVLSATNVSLVPHEMLAAGCIPVVNDAEHNRIVLDNPHVAYAPATPFELADALSGLVARTRDQQTRSARDAAASVASTTWEAAGSQVDQLLRRTVAARLGLP